MYTILRSAAFDRWLSRLRDRPAVNRIVARLLAAEDGHFGDVRPVGDGVSELRIQYGPGYRVYFITRGAEPDHPAMRRRQGQPTSGYRAGQENGDGMEGLMSEEYREFDAADYIKSEEDARGLLRAAMDEDPGDGAVIRAALKHVARTQNMSALARDTGLNRGNLYEALSEDGNPTLATLLKVANALGLRLRLEPVEDRALGTHQAS